MKKLFTYQAWTALGLALCAIMPARAAEPLQLPDLLVTAGIEPKPTKEVANSYTIIDHEQIEAHQYQTLADALLSATGVSLSPAGGRGAQTSIFMRGANSNQTLVLVNGQPANDPSSPAGAFNLANFTLSDVERIEIVRGPQSALYGSQAIGGVINIITKTGGGAPTNTIVAEGGSRGTLNLNLGTGGSLGKTTYNVTLWRQATKGNDVTPKRLRGAASKEKEENTNLGGSFALTAPLGDYLTASTSIRYTDAKVDLDEGGFDAFFNPVYEDLYNKSHSKELYASGSLKGNFIDGRWRPSLSFSATRYTAQVTDEADILLPTYAEDISNHGRRFTASFENAFDVTDTNTFNLGTSYEHENFRSNGFQDFGGGFVLNPASQGSTHSNAFYASDTQSIMDVFFLTVSGRYDAPKNSKNRFTFSIAPSYYNPDSDTKLFASYGTGFKTPSLYQRFGFTLDSFGGTYTGNPNLEAEKCKGWEAGFEQGLFESVLKFGGTYFHNKIENGIATVFDPFFNSTTMNSPTPYRTHGVEAFFEAKPLDNLTTRINYTYTVVNAQIISSTLTRRPRHQVSFDGIWQIDADTTLSTDVKWVDPYLDIRRDTPGVTFTKPGSYAVVNIAAERTITKGVAITARINNVLDRNYEPISGFEAQGLEALAGIKVSF